MLCKFKLYCFQKKRVLNNPKSQRVIIKSLIALHNPVTNYFDDSINGLAEII